jgi:glycosyltransferase involved in cell wall biosynthesis
MNALILDPVTTGHHAEYLRYLMEACGRRKDEGATFRFFVHAQVEEELGSAGGAVSVQALPAQADTPEKQLAHVLRAAGEGGGPVRLFLPRMNGYAGALLGGSLRVPVMLSCVSEPGNAQREGMEISGIWFGPRSAAWVHGGGGLRARLGGIREIITVRRLRDRAGLRRLFILNDPATARAMQRWLRLPGGVCALADPVPELAVPAGERPASRKRLELAPGTTAFGLLGALREAKGVEETLAALARWQPPSGRSATLLLAGEPLPEFMPRLERALADWRVTGRGVRLVTRLNRLSDADFAGCLAACDYLLLPYRNVHNSSGLLGHAAAVGKPVLASAGGLLGQLVREHGLGGTFVPRSARSFHAALEAALAGKVAQESILARRYLSENSVAAFQQTLLREAFIH